MDLPHFIRGFQFTAFFFVPESTGFPWVNVKITAILQQRKQSHFSTCTDKSESSSFRLASKTCTHHCKVGIQNKRFILKKKKKKIESVVIHSKKALQTADTVQKNRRCWPFYYRLFCSVALLSQAHPPAASHTRTHPHTYARSSALCYLK